MAEETVDLEITADSWTEVTGLILSIIYDLQNPTNTEVFIKKATAQPSSAERGKVILPFKNAVMVKLTTPVWLRSKFGTLIVSYDQRV